MSLSCTMQRSKAAVSLEVKQVIGTLCKLLAAVGLDTVPTPETFRRAKFGFGGEVESQFWQLIANILHSSGIVHSGVGSQLKGASEYKKLVAAGLWQTGYYADWMYGKEEEGEEGRNISSKDLLLAVGWLLSTETIEKLMMQQVQQLDKTLLTSIPVSHELQLDLTLLRRLQWLIGNLRHEGRILLSMLEEKTRLLHAVFSASLSSTVPYLFDQNFQALKDNCVYMQQLCVLLEAYVNWKQVEKVFWTWMDSVVDCHLSEPKKRTHVPSMSTIDCHHGNQGLEKLENMLMKLPTGQKGQRTVRRDAEERKREDLQDGLDTSLCLLISLPPLPSFYQAYRARLQAERPVRHNHYPLEELQNWPKTTESFQPSQAATVLLQSEGQLLQRRDQQRLANRMTLQLISGNMNNLVLMPP